MSNEAKWPRLRDTPEYQSLPLGLMINSSNFLPLTGTPWTSCVIMKCSVDLDSELGQWAALLFIRIKCSLLLGSPTNLLVFIRLRELFNIKKTVARRLSNIEQKWVWSTYYRISVRKVIALRVWRRTPISLASDCTIAKYIFISRCATAEESTPIHVHGTLTLFLSRKLICCHRSLWSKNLRTVLHFEFCF